MHKFSVRDLTLAAMVAALYAVMSYFGNIFGMTYFGIQFRFAEALTVLPFLFPATAPGLFVGCFIANILSPFGALDIVFGSLATLLAAFLTMKMPSKWLAPLPPVLCNGLIVGGLYFERRERGAGRAGRLLCAGHDSAGGPAENPLFQRTNFK
ncbi:MAG: QueT transporter family protein [Oscillospiraceae bacterium]